MSYQYAVKKYYRLKEKGIFDLACGQQVDLYPHDILTKNIDGTYTKHTGVARFGLKIPDDSLVKLVIEDKTLIVL
jgi:hypothetical protein